MCVTWLPACWICACALLGCVWVCSLHVRHDSVVWGCSVTCDVASLSVWHDSCMYNACLPVRSIFRALFLASCRCVVYMCDMTHSCVWRESFVFVLTCLYVWHDSCMCVTWLSAPSLSACVFGCFQMCTSRVWHDSSVCMTWPIHVCHMTQYPCVTWLHFPAWRVAYWCMCRDEFTWVPRRIYVCDRMRDTMRSYAWHDLFICVTWLIRSCDMTHSYAWHDLFTCVTWLIHVFDTTHIHMCGMTHSCLWHDVFICATGLMYTCDMTHSYVWYFSFTHVTWRIHICEMTH